MIVCELRKRDFCQKFAKDQIYALIGISSRAFFKKRNPQKRSSPFVSDGHSMVNHIVFSDKLGEPNTNTIGVEVVTLDDVIGDRKPVLLKIDTEGFETEVVAGANKTMEYSSLIGLIIEIKGHGNRYGFDEEKLYRRILEYGFKPCSYNPFNRCLREIEGSQGKGYRHRESLVFCKNVPIVRERLENAPTFKVLRKTL